MSTCPVSSPTASIWTTIGGNTACADNGFAIDSPSLTDVWTSSIAVATTRLLTVSLTISRACRMGTPDFSSIASVEANRDSATFWNKTPKIGTRSFMRSTMARPGGVFFQRRKKNRNTSVPMSTMYQYFLKMLDITSSTRVGSGSEPPSDDVDGLELRHDEQQHRAHDQDHQRHDGDRVGHRRLDLAAELDLRLDHVGEAEQHVVQ